MVMPRELRNVSREKIIVARALRARMTFAETLLWGELRGRRLAGLRFRRQHPVLGYIVDFYCHELRLAIEVDGNVHADREDCDAIRTLILREQKIDVLRLRNEQVIQNLSESVLMIENAIQIRRGRP